MLNYWVDERLSWKKIVVYVLNIKIEKWLNATANVKVSANVRKTNE